jgi:GNAT superfamily N-acetyltransferase
MRLVPADGPLLEQILDATYAVWHEGLTRDAYAKWNIAQGRTRWGAERLQRVALIDDDGRLLASAKRYLLDARLDRRDIRVLGIGAVFTQPEDRGRGYATRMLELSMDEARASGAAAAMLFSEIGTAFYERLSFRAVPVDEVEISVHLKGGTPAMLVRAGHESDLPALAAMHEVRAAASRFQLRRDPAQIQFALARRRLLAGLGTPGARHIEFHVAEEGASAVAYVILSVDEHGWTLSEAGDNDPAGARLGAIFQVLAAREPSRPLPTIRAWWPRAFPVPPQLQLSNRRDARDVLMMRALDDVHLPQSADEVFYWRGDFF